MRGPHCLGCGKCCRRSHEYSKRACELIWKDQGSKHRDVGIMGDFSIYYYNVFIIIII